MKGQVLHITFHNPNTRSDSEKIAGEFISRAATGVLTKMILDNQEKRILKNNSELKNCVVCCVLCTAYKTRKRGNYL